jgi:uncharacterized 2Fe-2S/4Fe-4S cluster protein (DUF4445 family)
VTVAVHQEAEIVAVEPGDTVGRNFGLAVDVGTTTLVMELVDVESGRTLDMEAALNSQSEIDIYQCPACPFNSSRLPER